MYTVEQNDAEELVARAARNIEQLLRKRSAALEVRLNPLTVGNPSPPSASLRLFRMFPCSMGVYGIRDRVFKSL